MKSSPAVLMLSNEPEPGAEAGFRDALNQLTKSPAVSRSQTVAARHIFRSGVSRENALTQITEACADFAPDVILVLSPGLEPWVADDVRSLLAASGYPTVVYWEGDPWGGRKRPTESMQAWLCAAEVTFSVAMGAQARMLSRLGAQDVRPILHTYCHVLFDRRYGSGKELTAPPKGIVAIGNGAVWRGVVAKVPGASARASLYRTLRRDYGSEFHLYGEGWSKKLQSGGYLPYSKQVERIQRSLLSVNWDHFPSLPGYYSDRLAISMMAGRVHASTLHPDSEWLPSHLEGLLLERSPQKLRGRVADAYRQPPELLLGWGKELRDWVEPRLSDREALSYMLSHVASTVKRPDVDPWTTL